MKRKLAIIQIILICLFCFWKCGTKETKPNNKPLKGSYDVSYVGNKYATTGIIAGRVTDKVSNRGVFLCNISIQGTETRTDSDLNGDYCIFHIPPGAYNVQAGRKGYPAVTAVNVKIEISKTTTINFQLVKDPSYEEPKIKPSPP